MEQQQQGYPPVGSVWLRTETDGTVTRRFVTTQWNGPDSVNFRENGDPHSTSVSLDLWHKWVRGVPPARMVVPGAPPLSRFAETNFAAAVEVNRELSWKLVTAERQLEQAREDRAQAIRNSDEEHKARCVAEAEKNLAQMTLNSQTQKLHAAEDQKRLAEKQLHAARQESLNLTLEARDAPELRRKLAEEVGKVIQLLAIRDRAIADREAAQRRADHIGDQLAKAIADCDEMKHHRDGALKSEQRMRSEVGELRSKLASVQRGKENPPPATETPSVGSIWVVTDALGPGTELVQVTSASAHIVTFERHHTGNEHSESASTDWWKRNAVPASPSVLWETLRVGSTMLRKVKEALTL